MKKPICLYTLYIMMLFILGMVVNMWIIRSIIIVIGIVIIILQYKSEKKLYDKYSVIDDIETYKKEAEKIREDAEKYRNDMLAEKEKWEMQKNDNTSATDSNDNIVGKLADTPPHLRDNIKLDFTPILFDKASAESAFNSFYAIDVETTGLDPKKDKIIEISAIHFENGEPIETFTTLVNPQMNIPKEATKINKITDDMVKDAPNISKAIGDFWRFIYKSDDEILLCAHNANFDIEFIKNNIGHASIRDYQEHIYYIDTLKISQKFLKGKIRNHKLTTILNFFDIKTENTHRAEDDALSCGKVFVKFSKKLLEIYDADFDVKFNLIGSSSNKIQENIESRKIRDELKYHYNSGKEKYEVYFEWFENEILGYIPKPEEKYIEDKSRNWIVEITNIEVNKNMKYVVEIGLKNISF